MPVRTLKLDDSFQQGGHLLFKEISVGVALWCFREAVKNSEIWQF